MIKFTKEEINLCKQVAERYWKEIENGDWFINIKSGDVPFLCQYGTVKIDKDKIIPLWTISDCLEFLRGKWKKLVTLPFSLSQDILDMIISILMGKASINDLNVLCLKAVLAVLGEKK